jgi:hypothetical protein
MLGEMVFGTIPLSQDAVMSKIHFLSQHEVMITKVFPADRAKAVLALAIIFRAPDQTQTAKLNRKQEQPHIPGGSVIDFVLTNFKVAPVNT